ncbi:MAG: helix-turn-helix domain-containing protein [bacterium]
MKLMTVKEVCEFLNISKSTVYRLKDCGELPFYSIGSAIRFDEADLVKFLEKAKSKPWNYNIVD